jgi:type IV pilus assembly protein PilQ
MKNPQHGSFSWGLVLGLTITGCALPLQVQTAQPLANTVLPKADQRISLNFQDVALKTLLQVFADFTGLNLVAAEGVGGQITIRLTDVPWPQALNIVLQAKGLAYRLEGQVLWVAPQDE